MGKGAANKLILGMFVTIALGLFIGAIYYMGKQRKMFGDSIKIYATFKNVGGLMVGNNVRFAGINVGTVDNITILNDSTVEVAMILEKKVQPFVKKDSKAIIGAEGLMGNKLINILPGSSTASVEAHEKIGSAKAVDYDDILVNLERTSENAVVISQELAEMTQKINNSNGTLSRFLYDSTFAEIIESSLRNVEKGTSGFSENMEAMKSNFLFRGYYKKKEKEKEEAAKAAREKKEGDANGNGDEKDLDSRKKSRLKFWK